MQNHVHSKMFSSIPVMINGELLLLQLLLLLLLLPAKKASKQIKAIKKLIIGSQIEI